MHYQSHVTHTHTHTHTTRATSYGKSTPHFMESLDLYRTLASLAFANEQ